MGTSSISSNLLASFSRIFVVQMLKGHNFRKSPYWLKKDYKKTELLCLKCKLDIYAKRFQDFADKEGRQLLIPYKGRFKPKKKMQN